MYAVRDVQWGYRNQRHAARRLLLLRLSNPRSSPSMPPHSRPLRARPGMPAKLTVIIPCKNERTNIGPCLDSVASIADELLVADSGSTDGTLEYVAARGDCRVIE